MSQQLTPINGGVIPEVQTSVATTSLKVLSPQYVEVNNLHTRPTEWIPGGRPIYRRLPATSETYQINFFNVVTESNVLGNTFVKEGIEEVGYVYVPYGLSINGSQSVEVVAAQGNKALLIKAGNIVWKYGKNQALPTIADLKVLDIGSGKYEVAYQLLYDDSPQPLLYSVTDFALTGLPLNITASTDSVIGWRYPAVNAFLNESSLSWSNEDTLFPPYAQPTSAYIQWQADLGQAYSQIVMRCPSGTGYTGTATLFYENNGNLAPVKLTGVSEDSSGQFFQFDIEEPAFQTGWNVTFSSDKVSIESIVVSGTVTLLESQASPSPRARLVMYPSGTLPKTTVNGQGKTIPTTYCALAEVDVGDNYNILNIEDTRTIIHRDYSPVADWLTTPFDADLINLYEQVSDYAKLWMAPPSCMKQEYASLKSSQITVEV